MLLLINVITMLVLFKKVRVVLLNLIPNYKISLNSDVSLFSIIVSDKIVVNSNATIGLFVIIYDCKVVTINCNSKLYRFVKIMGLNNFSIGVNSLIGVGTQVISRHIDRKINKVINGGRFIIGSNVVITNKHLFDLSGNILIKESVVIGGANSLFYTHGFDCYGNFSYGDIVLHKKIYIGAGCIFLPGIRIYSEIVIGAGALVSKSLLKKGVYGGNPIKMISDNPQFNKIVVRK